MASRKPLVVLKSKMGELGALRRLRSEQDAPATVLVEVLDSVDAGNKRLLQALLKAAVHVAGLGRSLWIDTHRLTATSPLAEEPGGPFAFLDERIEAASRDEFGLFTPDLAALVPVVPIAASDADLGAIALLQEHHRRDVVVRIEQWHMRLPELIERIQDVARRTRVGAGHLHAVIDVGFIPEVRTTQIKLVSRLAVALGELLGPGSTTLLAGSIPPERAGFVTTAQDRPEVSLWRAVNKETRTFQTQYGDYGVVHPIPSRSSDSKRFSGVNPYLYYTVPGKTVALRRKLERENRTPVPGAADAAFADLAEELVDRPEFAGGDYSWGDLELTQCRRGSGKSASTVPQWIAMATSHHLAHVARRTSTDL